MFDTKMKELLSGKFPGILFDECLSGHTTMGVGGPADGFLFAEESNIKEIIEFSRCNNIKYTILGNGSNTVGADEGFRGIVICIGRKMNSVEVSGELEITAGAGAKLSAVSEVAAKNSIAGFEFLSGIPGNLGGALVMNAGAYGGEISKLIVSVTYLLEGEEYTVSPDKLEYGYRESFFINNPDAVITRAVLKGVPGDEKLIREEMGELIRKRNASQPLEYPSSGSFFKRPQGYFAGKLIQDSDLKGYSCGGAQISEKHAGFVINTGGATCKDIIGLAEHVKKTVYDKFGVILEPEVRFLR